MTPGPPFFQRIFNSRKYFFQFLFFDSANDGPAEAVAVFFASGAVGQEQSFFGKVQGAVAVTAVRLFFKGHGVSKGLAVVFAHGDDKRCSSACEKFFVHFSSIINRNRIPDGIDGFIPAPFHAEGA